MKKILIILMTLCLFGCIGTEKSNIKGNITITYPENGNNNISNNDLTVVWEIDTTENLEYKVSIISSDGTVIQKSTTQKSIKFTNLESGKEYTVEVAGYLNGDKYGSDSVEITTAFGEVSLLYPLSGTVVSNLPTFAWSSTTEIETDLIYDVYVGESIESLLKVAGNISTNSYTLSVKLKDESEYFGVVEKNGDGVKLKESEIYSFTTEQLNSNSETIDIPKIVNPAIGDLNKGIESDLEWSYIGDYSKITFKVYLGSDINNLNLQNSLVGKLNYNISGLSYGTKYYWKVVASDSLGNSSESAIAYFTTEDAQIVLSTPSITAPAIGEIGVATATKLSWSYSGEYAGLIFKVYYGTSSSNLTLLGNVIGELS